MDKNTIARYDWLDIIKGICMYAVILFHLDGPEFYDRILTPFFLCGFFYCGGYTFRSGKKFNSFFLKKLKTLFLPVILFGIVNMLLSYLWYGTDLLPRISGILLQIPGKFDDMWFVACLFTMELMFWGITAMTDKISHICIASLILFLTGYAWLAFIDIPLPWHIVNACLMMPFLCAGYFMKSNRSIEKIQKILNKTIHRYIISLISAIVFILTVCIYDNADVDPHLLRYGYVPAFIASSISGTWFIILISLIIEKVRNPVTRYITYMGRNTLSIYGLQSKAITFITYIAAVCGISYNTIISAPIAAFIVSLILIPVAYLIRRYAPFMIGKYEKRLLPLL